MLRRCSENRTAVSVYVSTASVWQQSQHFLRDNIFQLLREGIQNSGSVNLTTLAPPSVPLKKWGLGLFYSPVCSAYCHTSIVSISEHGTNLRGVPNSKFWQKAAAPFRECFSLSLSAKLGWFLSGCCCFCYRIFLAGRPGACEKG